MRIGSVVILVGVTVAAGVDDLARAQNGRRTAVGFAVAIGGELLAHTFGERQAAAGASVAVAATDFGAILGGSGLWAQKVRMIFNLGRFGIGTGRVTGGAWTGRMSRTSGGMIRIGLTLRAGEWNDLGTDNRCRTMHFAEVRERQLAWELERGFFDQFVRWNFQILTMKSMVELNGGDDQTD